MWRLEREWWLCTEYTIISHTLEPEKCVYMWCLCTVRFSCPFTFALVWRFWMRREKNSRIFHRILAKQKSSLMHKMKFFCQTITQVSEILCLFNYCQWPMGLHIKWKHRSIYSVCVVYLWPYAQRTYRAMNGILIAAKHNNNNNKNNKIRQNERLGTTNCQWFLTEVKKRNLLLPFKVKRTQFMWMIRTIWVWRLQIEICHLIKMPIYMLNWFHIFRTLAFRLID